MYIISNFVNKYWFHKYKALLVKNQILIFCESNSFDVDLIRSLKKELNRKGFSLMNLKNGVFKLLVNDSNFCNLVHGPVFVIYKTKIDNYLDLKILFYFIQYNCILGCFYDYKFYDFWIFNKFNKKNNIKDFLLNILFDIRFKSLFKMQNTLKQLTT